MLQKSRPDNIRKDADPFDEMFSFEATLKDRLTPAQLDQIEREEMVKRFGGGNAWLSQPEQRADFLTLDARGQLQATFAEFKGYSGSELQVMIAHLRGDLGKARGM